MLLLCAETFSITDRRIEMRNYRLLVCVGVLIGSMYSAGASAQSVTIGSNATLSVGSLQSGADQFSLGTAQVSTYVSAMPISQSFGALDVSLSFTGVAGVFGARDYWNPGATNFIRTDWVNNGGAATFTFSETQRYFGMQWGSPDTGNQIQFYNGQTLVGSAGYSDITSLGARFTPAGAYAEFNFAGTGFDRVVTTTTNGAWEYSKVAFADEVNPAPIPVGGLGGLLACLGMLGASRG
jgi:hypothetical protein